VSPRFSTFEPNQYHTHDILKENSNERAQKPTLFLRADRDNKSTAPSNTGFQNKRKMSSG
jgi:hypothetical protein